MGGFRSSQNPNGKNWLIFAGFCWSALILSHDQFLSATFWLNFAHKI